MRLKKFEVRGAKELERLMLQHLPATLARKATLAGMRKAAKPMVDMTKAKAPFRSGALRQSIGISTVTTRGGTTLSQLTGFVGGNESTFAAIEIGPLSGGSGASLHAWARYKAFYGPNFGVLKHGRVAPSLIGRIRHGHLMEFGFTHTSGKRVRAQPFLGPGFRAGYPIYNSMFVNEVRKKVEAAITKHNARSPAST